MIKTCVMEVRPGQRLSTIAQAMAHNTNTVRGDMDMLEQLCLRRGHNHVIDQLRSALEYLDGAYNEFLAIFSEELRHDIAEHGDTPDPEYHHDSPGNERTAESIAADAAHHHVHPHEEPAGLVHGPHFRTNDGARDFTPPHTYSHVKAVDRKMLEEIGLSDNPAALAACDEAARYETR